MKTLKIRAIGRLPEPWQKEAETVYAARIKPFAKLEIIELPEGQKGSAKPNEEQTKKTEAASLLKGIPDDAFVVALGEAGKEMDSVAFSKKLSEWGDRRTVVFLIGGSWGLHSDIKQKVGLWLSFGRMTLPHGLARVVLLEQLYRALMIEAGKTYQK